MVSPLSTPFKQITQSDHIPDPVVNNIIAMPMATYYAYMLYDMGLSIMPVLNGVKEQRCQWAELQLIRFERKALDDLFPPDELRNLAVVCSYANLFVLDYDDLEVFNSARVECKKRDIKPFAVTTSRGGHLYFIAVDSLPRSQDLPGVEVKAAGKYVIGPGSVHPSGACYELYHDEQHGFITTIPHVSINQLDWIPLTPKKRGKKHGKVASEYVRTGSSIPQGQRNNRLFDAVKDGRNAGWTHDYARAVLSPPALASGLPQSEIDATIRSAYTGQYRTTKSNRLAQLLAFAGAYDWPARTRRTDTAVFLALVERWRLDALGTAVFRASLREIQELTLISDRRTVERSLQRLQRTGLLVLGQSKGNGAARRKARRWRFSRAVWQLTPSANIAGSFVASYTSSPTDYSHVYNGVICNKLQQTPHTQQQLAESIGCHKSTVSRVLKQLVADGHATHDGGRPAVYDLTAAGIDAAKANAQATEQHQQKQLVAMKAQHGTDRAVWLHRRFTRWFAKHDGSHHDQ